MGLDTCDNVLTVLSRSVAAGTLTVVGVVSPTNPAGNTMNADKVLLSVVAMVIFRVC